MAIDHPKEGRFETVAAPLSIANSRIAPRGPAPELGAHTREALAEHGFTVDEIGALDAEGVLG